MKSVFVKFAVAGVAVVLLAGCGSGDQVGASDDAKALRENGYSRPPRVTGVAQVGKSSFELSGMAIPDGRVLFIYSGHNAAGQAQSTRNGNPVDSKGRFKVAMPSGALGGLYDLQMDDTARQLHAEGRLFVPLDHAGKAVLLRPGGASIPLGSEKNVMAVVDYDGGGGLAVAGKVEAGTTVNLIVGGVIIGRGQSDDTGRYHLTTEIVHPTEVPTEVHLTIQAGSDSAEHTITVSTPMGGDLITRLPDGWRVDWGLPGGGNQTALVF